MKTKSILLFWFLFYGITANAQIIVTNLNDTGAGSLRDAIAQANANPGPDDIVFVSNMTGEIILDAALVITGIDGNSTTINGDTNGDGKPDITITTTLGGFSGLSIESGSCTIANLNFTGFINSPNAAIQLDGALAADNLITGNYIGTDLSGTAAGAANFRGIALINGASNNRIGDGTPPGQNIISNGSFGVYIANSNNNIISGNIIGLDVGGVVDLGNGGSGIEVLSSDGTQIGIPGSLPNIISGNSQEGISLTDSPNTLVYNNYIGTDVNGSFAIQNNWDGILVTGIATGTEIGSGIPGSGNLISGNGNQGIEVRTDGVVILGNIIGLNVAGNGAIPNTSMGILSSAPTSITIGDGTVEGRNTISGNGSHGIQLTDGTNRIYGNYIGLGSNGDLLLGNSGIGVFVSGGSGSEIGGLTTGQGNVIGGNAAGIQISVGTHSVFANIIGLNASGTAVRANNEGIRLVTNAQNTVVGDGTPTGANYISGNTQEGILLDGAGATGNIIQGNYIGVQIDQITPAGNGTSGVIISGDASLNTIKNNVIANNADSGIEANGIFATNTLDNTFSQNSIYSNTTAGISVINGAQAGITGPTVDLVTATFIGGSADANVLVEVFADSFDQGEFFIGSTTADAAGGWTLIYDPSTIPPGLKFITATQTNGNNSSEFSNPPIPLDIPFITTWSTSDGQIIIPVNTIYTYNYDITWTNLTSTGVGDGSATAVTGSYTISGLNNGDIYQIEITGTFPQIFFAAGTEVDKILTVEQWGSISWSSMEQTFEGCTNLTIPATDAPDLSNVTSMLNMFANASSFNQDISAWDVSKVTNMSSLFVGATSFNQPLNTWDVSSVTDMNGMFRDCSSFNQPLDSWDVSNVIYTYEMFMRATAFNQPLGTWNVSKVTNMGYMFENASSFNQDLSSWDVSNVTVFWYTFRGASSFDQSLGNWDISAAVFMNDMLNSSGLSEANYDATLIGWDALTTTPTNMNFGAVGLYYCSGETARNNLINTNGWLITDSGSSCAPAPGPHIYWTDGMFDITAIGRSLLDGTSFQPYHAELGAAPADIAIDTLNNVAYWTNNYGQIRMGDIGVTGFTTTQDFINDGLDLQREWRGLALDVPNGKIYWADADAGAIKTASLFDPTPINTIQTIISGLQGPSGIAIDPANSKLYYSTIIDNVAVNGTQIAELHQANLDGTGDITLYTLNILGQLSTFFEIVLDPTSNMIYWSSYSDDPGEAARIYSADLTNISGTVSSFPVLGVTMGFDIDFTTGKIYWAEFANINIDKPPFIRRANLDGTAVENLPVPKSYLTNPMYLVLDVSLPAAGCTNPPTISVSNDQIICENSTASVLATIGGGASTVTWSTAGDGSFNNATSLNPDYTPGTSDITNGSVLLTATTDDPDGAGACVAASASLTLGFEALPIAIAGNDIYACNTNPITLSGSIGGTATSSNWVSAGDGFFNDATLLNATYTPGTNDIANGAVTLSLLGLGANVCNDGYDEIIITFAQPIAAINQTAALDVLESVTIDVKNGATLTTNDTITTTLLSDPQKGTATIEADGSITYTAALGNVGQDTFDFQICNQCGMCSTAQVIININNQPPIVDVPPADVISGGVATINVLDFITDNNGNLDLSTLSIVSDPASGATASIDGSGLLSIDYQTVTFTGQDQLTIRVCDFDGLCTEQVIYIDVAPPTVTVYNAVSPNGDGMHDYLELENIEFFPDNQVRILNRWGDIVFEMKGYDNAANSFQGKGNKNSNGELPPGTYFYSIVLESGAAEITGFFELRR